MGRFFMPVGSGASFRGGRQNHPHPSPRPKHGIDQFDSDFESAVAFKLHAKGWNVVSQVGVGKFRIDLRVVHPEKPGEGLSEQNRLRRAGRPISLAV